MAINSHIDDSRGLGIFIFEKDKKERALGTAIADRASISRAVVNDSACPPRCPQLSP